VIQRGISDDRRLWGEHSNEEQPQYYEYPTDGHVISKLYVYKEAEFVQVSDFAKKQRIYYIFLDAETCTLITTDRTEAGVEWERVKELMGRRSVE
jgi:hypothetical protein